MSGQNIPRTGRRRLIGIDLVEVAEVEEALRAHGDRYAARLLTPGERLMAGGSARRMAACWAAKEATMKALRPGPRNAVGWREVALEDAGNNPRVTLTGGAAELARCRKVIALNISVSADTRQAWAIVIAEALG